MQWVERWTCDQPVVGSNPAQDKSCVTTLGKLWSAKTRIGPLHLQAGGHRRRPNLALGFWFHFVTDACLLCCVCFSFSVLSQEIGWEERLWDDPFCVGWDLKPYNSVNQSIRWRIRPGHCSLCVLQRFHTVGWIIRQRVILIKTVVCTCVVSYKRSAALSQFVIHRGLIISSMQAVFSAVFYFISIALFPGFLLVGYVTI